MSYMEVDEFAVLLSPIDNQDDITVLPKDGGTTFTDGLVCQDTRRAISTTGKPIVIIETSATLSA